MEKELLKLDTKKKKLILIKKIGTESLNGEKESIQIKGELDNDERKSNKLKDNEMSEYPVLTSKKRKRESD